MNFDTVGQNPTVSGENVADGKAINVSLVKAGTMEVANTASNSLMTVREGVKQQLIASGEAKALSDQLAVTNPQSIIEFGKPVAEQMSKCADEILRKQDITTLTQTSNMMGVLTKIMDKVDLNEIDDMNKEKGLFGKIFSNAQRKMEQLVSKYNNIGDEIEKVCIELRTYERQIEESNKDLEALYANGIVTYQSLLKYTIAGEEALKEIDEYRRGVEARAANDPQASMELSQIDQAKQLLEQRVQDLRLAETVALQSLPTIKAMEFGNLNLARKINSSFIVTIPVFKNAIAQAIMAKRQALQMQAMQTLDEKTNEMLMRNAQNVADNMRNTATLVGSSAIKIETVENSWRTIMDGIRDTREIQNTLMAQRESDKARLEQINQQYISQVQ